MKELLEKMGKKRLIIWLISIFVICLFIWATRPWWHGIFVGLYRNPAILFSLIVAIVTGIVTGVIKKPSLLTYKGRFLGGICVGGLIFALLIAIFMPFQVMYPQCDIAKEIGYKRIEKLPDIEMVRILPQKVAERYASDALQYPRFRMGKPDIAFIEEKPAWVFPIVPDGIVNFFRLKGKGALYVNMGTAQKNTQIIEQDMMIGPCMGIMDNWLWQIYKRNFWRDYEDPYFISAKDELYIVAPIIRYEWHFRFPTFYTIKRWDGVVLIDSQGEIKFLSSEKAKLHPVLDGQKVYPEKLTRYYIESLRYIHGIKNRLFIHREQLEVADATVCIRAEDSDKTVSDNQQPFLITTETGIKWFIACEPAGRAHGIYKIFLVDAKTGEIDYYEQPPTDVLIGPVKACDYVRKNNPRVTWGQMAPVEPIPIIQNNILYWEVRVIPIDGAGVAYTAFVNSKTGDVVEYTKDSEVRGFIKGKQLIEEIIKKEEKPSEWTIIIECEDGRRREIPIYKGEKVIIKETM